MTNWEHKVALASSCVVLLVCSACSPRPITRDVVSINGCIPPPPNIFTSVGADISIAQSTIGKVVTGDVKIKTQPEVISLLSKSMVDQELRTYLRCIAIKHNNYTPEQAAYLERMSYFSATSPSPEQFQKWQDTNPFPPKTPDGETKNAQDGAIIRIVDSLRREFRAATSGRKPPLPSSSFERIDELIKTLEQIDINNGHALYYAAEVKRWTNKKEDSHKYYYYYIDFENTLNSKYSREGSIDVEVCYQRPNGYCRQRTGWILHNLANDLWEKEHSEYDLNTKVSYCETALKYVNNVLLYFPGGFKGANQRVPTDALKINLINEIERLKKLPK